MKFEIDLKLPDEITDAIFEEQVAKPVREEVVLRLFGERKIPGGLAARLLRLTRRQFLDLLKMRGIPHTDYTFEEWKEDDAAIRRVFGESGGKG